MPRFLVAESETSEERRARRRRSGRSSGESFAETLRQLEPEARVEVAPIADPEAEAWTAEAIAGFDGVFLAGSPLHVHEPSPEAARAIGFMRAVFASGVPSFGSCAGLQIAVAAAGGRTGPMRDRMEAGLARRLVATPEGRDHPLLAGRPATWDAAALHGDEVDALPPDATLLAGSAATRVQAVEIRHGRGLFWGVQYHPELSLEEMGAALRRQAGALVESGLARSRGQVRERARLLEALHEHPDDRALRWRLGVDDEVATVPGRRRELRAFLDARASLDRRDRAMAA